MTPFLERLTWFLEVKKPGKSTLYLPNFGQMLQAFIKCFENQILNGLYWPNVGFWSVSMPTKSMSTKAWARTRTWFVVVVVF